MLLYLPSTGSLRATAIIRFARPLAPTLSLFVYINLSLSSSSFFFYKGKEKEGNEFVRSAKEEALVATQSINI